MSFALGHVHGAEAESEDGFGGPLRAGVADRSGSRRHQACDGATPPFACPPGCGVLRVKLTAGQVLQAAGAVTT